MRLPQTDFYEMMKKLLISFAENFDDEKMVFLDFDFQSNDV